MENRARYIAVNAVLIAVMVIFCLIMKIPILPISVAFLPLITLVVGVCLEGKITSFILSFTFGVMSLVGAYLVPSPLAPIFQNPLISLVPRLFVGIIGYGAFLLTKNVLFKIKKLSQKKDLVIMISTFVCALFIVVSNTALVLPMIYLVYHGQNIGGTSITIEFVLGLVSLNFVIELVVTLIISPIIVKTLYKYTKNVQVIENYEDLFIVTDNLENNDIDKESIVVDDCDNDKLNKTDSDEFFSEQ